MHWCWLPRYGPRLSVTSRCVGLGHRNRWPLLRPEATSRLTQAHISLGVHNQSSNPQFAIAGHFVGDPTANFLYRRVTRGGQVIIACLCAGMLGGGAFALAISLRAAITFTGPIVVASAIAIV